MRIWNNVKLILSWIIVIALLVTCAVWASFAIQKSDGEAFPSILGWGFATVASGSMEPQIPVGAILAIQSQDSYSVGDVVMYQDGSGKLITHRITEITEDAIITKGDANEEPDPPICSSQIMGKVRFSINGFRYYYRRYPLPTVYGAIIILLICSGLIRSAVSNVHNHLTTERTRKST